MTGIITGQLPSSLGGNTAQYAENKSGGSKKVRKNSKKGKRTAKKAKKRSSADPLKNAGGNFFRYR